MTDKRIREIKKFFSEISFKLEFLKDKNDWEYEFLFNSAKTYEITEKEMKEFIKLYLNNKISKEVQNKYKVIDLETGVTYKSIRECGIEYGMKFTKAYWWIKKNSDKFKLVKIDAI